MSEDVGDLAERMHAGDEKARAELVTSNMPLVHYIVNTKCRSHIREDVVQEAAIKLWLAAPKHNPKKTKFFTYAFACIKNKVLDLVKSESRYSSRIHPMSKGFDKVVTRTPLDDIVQSENRILIADLHKAVQELPLYERFVVTFRYGLYSEVPHTLREISEMLKVPYSAAKSIEKRAYKRLKDRLTPENEL